MLQLDSSSTRFLVPLFVIGHHLWVPLPGQLMKHGHVCEHDQLDQYQTIFLQTTLLFRNLPFSTSTLRIQVVFNFVRGYNTLRQDGIILDEAVLVHGICFFQLFSISLFTRSTPQRSWWSLKNANAIANHTYMNFSSRRDLASSSPCLIMSSIRAFTEERGSH